MGACSSRSANAALHCAARSRRRAASCGGQVGGRKSLGRRGQPHAPPGWPVLPPPCLGSGTLCHKHPVQHQKQERSQLQVSKKARRSKPQGAAHLCAGQACEVPQVGRRNAAGRGLGPVIVLLQTHRPRGNGSIGFEGAGARDKNGCRPLPAWDDTRHQQRVGTKGAARLLNAFDACDATCRRSQPDLEAHLDGGVVPRVVEVAPVLGIPEQLVHAALQLQRPLQPGSRAARQASLQAAGRCTACVPARLAPGAPQTAAAQPGAGRCKQRVTLGCASWPSPDACWPAALPAGLRSPNLQVLHLPVCKVQVQQAGNGAGVVIRKALRKAWSAGGVGKVGWVGGRNAWRLGQAGGQHRAIRQCCMWAAQLRV